MARYKNYNNRSTLRYDMNKEQYKFDRMVEKMENQAIKAAQKSQGYGNKAMAEKIKEFKDQNAKAEDKVISQGIKAIKQDFKTKREEIATQIKDEQKEKMSSLRKLVATTPTKYKLLNDELDPGVTLVGYKRKPNTTAFYDDNELKGFHKDMEDNFFKRITNAFDVMSDGKQSVTKFVKDTNDISIMNYSNLKTKANQGPQSIRDTWDHIKTSGFVVGYDLETIGGKNQHGIWEPTAITEYSFQTLNVKDTLASRAAGANWDDPVNDILKKNIVSDSTAVMGISKSQADDLYGQIELAVKNGTIKERNDLWVTANRMMKYGNDKTRFEKGADGLTRAVDFVNEDAVNNVFNLDTIKKGLNKHVNVYNNAKEIDGIKDYEWHFLNTVANIKKNDYAVMGFNDAFFDSPIMDSQLNKIVDTYKNNTQAMSAIDKMFGGNVSFNPASNRRLDLRAAINMATESKGYESIYGTGMNDFINSKALKGGMLARQEYLVEHHFNNMFNTGTAHLAVEDVRNLLRLGFAGSDKLGGKSLFESTFDAMNSAYPEAKNSILSFDKNIDKILYSNRPSGSATYTGRGVLGFSIDRTTGAVKTSAGFNIGGANDALGDISKQNIVGGGTISANQFYKFGGIQKVELTDEFIQQANKHMPEYARREMYAVRLDQMMSDRFKDHEGASKSSILFFNELAEAEAQISSMFTYMGDNDGTFRINENEKNAVMDILTKVSMGQDGKYSIAEIAPDSDSITKAFEMALDAKSERTVTDRARRHAVDSLYKKSHNYAKLIDTMESNGIDTSSSDKVKDYLLDVSRRLSNSVSRNEVLDGKDSLVLNALGFKNNKINSANSYLYGSTLSNYIESNDLFFSRNKGMNRLYSFLAQEQNLGVNTLANAFNDSDDYSRKLAVSGKFEEMYDYLLNTAANEIYSTPEDVKKALTLAGNSASVSIAELKGYYEFDVSGLGKQDGYMKKTISNLDSNTLRVNLKSGDEYKLVDKAFKLYYGDYADEAIDGRIKKASAMKKFITDMSKNNQELFSSNSMQSLLDEISKGAKDGGTISPEYMATKLIKNLQQVKEDDFMAGVANRDFNISNLVAKDSKVISRVNEYLQDDNMLKKAFDSTSLYKNVYENDKNAIQNVVDKYFMPTFNNMTGSKALEAIKNQGIYTSKQSKVLDLNWNKAREAHIENIGKLFGLVSQGGGTIHFNNTGINVDINGEMLNFDGLAKTRYSNGTLEHYVSNSKVASHLNLGWDAKTKGFNIQSNLKDIYAKSYANFNLEKMNKAIDAGEFDITMLKMFAGSVQGKALEEAVISNYNLHELNTQFRFGLGDAVGKHLDELVGTEKNVGKWGNLELIDKDAMARIRKIVNSDNWKNGSKEITPELKELLVKNMIPLLKTTESGNTDLMTLLDMATFSNKDTQVANSSTDIHLGERYSQRWLDNYDNAQRPVTAAQKMVFDRNKLEKGIANYIEATGGNKDIFAGSLIDEATTRGLKTLGGVMIDGAEQAITMGKTNIGQIGLQAILENNFEKVISSNNTIANLDRHHKILQYEKMKKKMNLFEQEKVMDARLMDSIFEMASNKQSISGNYDYKSWLTSLDQKSGKISEFDQKIAERLARVQSAITLEDGKISYSSTAGELVDRGEAIMKYIGFGDKEATVNSKQFKGRLKFGVFEKNGGMQLDDSTVSEFLQRNIDDIQSLAKSYGGGSNNIQLASNEILSQYFNVGYYVSDVRQKTYMKVMNEGVEKDMTYGLYSGLGELDTRVNSYLEGATYQGKKLKDFKGDVLTMSEIDEIFVKNFDSNVASKIMENNKQVFKSGEDLKKAILAERYFDSKNVFDYIDEFNKSSLLTTHAVAKHSNSGMIFENIVGSAFSVYKQNYGQEEALVKLRKQLIDNNVIDMFDDNGKYVDEVLTIQHGKLLHKAVKSNKAETSRDILDTVETLNIENLMNMIKSDSLLNETLYHKDAKIFDQKADSKYTKKDVFGDIIRTDFSYKDKVTGAITELRDIVMGTNNQTSAELAIDPEYMTVYDHSTLKNLEKKASIDRSIVDNKVKINNLETKKKDLISRGGAQTDIENIQIQIDNLVKTNTNLKIDKAEVADAIGDMTNISKGKKIGAQEFNLYDMKVINSNSGEAIAEFMEKNKGVDDNVLSAFKSSFAGILTDDYKVEEEYRGHKVLEGYMNRLKKTKLYNSTATGLGDSGDMLRGTDIALTDDIVNLDEYKHLKPTYEKIKSVVGERLGADTPISVRYAEEAFRIDSAHKAYKFNKDGSIISQEALERYGFEKIGVRDLVVTGEAAESLNIDSMFTKNYLVDMGEFGTIALPKSGQITGNQDIKTKFQSGMIGIQKTIKEYDELYATGESEAANDLRNSIINRIDAFKENMRSDIYDKQGMLYNAGKVEVAESFRAKSSTATVLSDVIRGIEGVANDKALEESIDVISSKFGDGKSLLDKARINGVSISDWEKKGIYHDYMFASKDIFENLGYFDEARMAEYFKVDKSTVAKNMDEYTAKMTDALQTHGDMFMSERYPAIWIGSDKPTKVFLDNETTKTNRLRLSMATMLSMNGDNDGDSISASLIRTEGGNNYLKYAMEKESYIADNNLQLSRYKADVVKQIDNEMIKTFGAEDAKAFKALEFDMSTEAITANAHFYKKGMGDMVDELQTAVANGDLNSVKAVKFNSLYGGKLYANYGGTSSLDGLNKNIENVNNMIDMATKANEQFKSITGGTLRAEGETYGLNINSVKVGDYTDHLNENLKVFDAMQSPNSYDLNAQQKSALNIIKRDMNITDDMINSMRDDAVIQARWMDYQSETMAKARKGSIGPINVALQQHRQAVSRLYDDPTNIDDYAKKLAVQHISKEIEQEVISSKKGNVIYNMTKTTDLIDTYRQVWNQGASSTMELRGIDGNTTYTTARNALSSWINENIDNKKVKEIIQGMEDGTKSKSYVKNAFGFNASEITDSNVGMVREKLVGSYVSTLDSLGDSTYASAVRRSSRQGGNMVDDSSVVSLDSFQNLNDMMSQILTHGDDRITNTRSASTGIVNMASSEKAVSTIANIADRALDMKVGGMSGLAVGALGVAAGMLVSGFAGGPVDQKSASDYAQEEKPKAVSVPTMMDQGGFATTGGNSGYVINVRANTAKDLKTTKKALRHAASASAGGGVNVNMNIKDKTQAMTEYDLEQMIAGIF